MTDTLKRLGFVQAELKAPKGQTNNFGKYKYRSCEDILEALKPLLSEHSLTLTLSDTIELIGNRFYIRADAVVFGPDDNDMGVSACGYARECETKKGMDDAQLTGSCSSYARKYALNGLFLIDDTKDADTMDNSKPDYTDEQKIKFHELFNKSNAFQFYCYITHIGTDAFEALYTTFPKDGTIGKKKDFCNEMVKEGNATATDIADRTTELVSNDDPAYDEELNGLTIWEKKIVASRMSKETLEKIKQLKEQDK